MLILKRFVNEVIVIHTDPPIRLMVTEVHGEGKGWAKIGIDAPVSVKVLREEIADLSVPESTTGT